MTFLIGTTLASGVGAVAATAKGSAKVCETAKHLVVGAVHGRCPKHTTKHTIATTGARGLPGAPGSNGLSVALVGTSTGASTATAFTDSTYTPVMTIPDAPAGNYVVSFDYNPSTNTYDPAGTALVECEVATATTQDGVASGYVTTPRAIDLSAVDTVTLSSAGAIDVSCSSLGGINVYPSPVDAHLVATRVNAFAN
jgi:hypothetical protein